MKKIFLLMFFVSLFTTTVFAAAPLTLTVQNSPGDTGLNHISIFNLGTGTQITNCGNATCTINVPAQTKVRLVASGTNPHTGFFKWGQNSGSAAVCANSSNYICEFTMTQASSATATFRKIFNFRVQLGTGDGKIKVTPKNGLPFECANRAPLSCSQGALEGTPYKLEAIAGQLSQFQGWSNQTGNATVCTGAGANFTCQFTITQETSLVGNFMLIP